MLQVVADQTRALCLARYSDVEMQKMWIGASGTSRRASTPRLPGGGNEGLSVRATDAEGNSVRGQAYILLALSKV